MRYHTILFILLIMFRGSLAAQIPYNVAAPNGYTKKATICEQIGLTMVSITYHRPSVMGREGKIWGEIIHNGFKDLGFGKRNPAPWRAGANENTIIEFNTDVKLEGQTLAKGKYGFFIAYDPLETIVILSKKSDAWGSFFYDEKEDALRVKVKPRSLEKSVENLKYEFVDQTSNSAVITLSWEKKSIPFKIEVDYLRQQYEAFIAESQNPGGFTAQGLNIAASWALQNNYGLEKALDWSNLATSHNFPGDPNSFSAWTTKVLILNKLGKKAEVADAISSALPLGNINQIQQFGRQLLTARQPAFALDVFQFNYNKSPDHFITLTGMVRGLSGINEYAKALEFANRALSMAPNEASKQAVQEMIEKLKTGNDIN
jgi:hypothetical protein